MQLPLVTVFRPQSGKRGFASHLKNLAIGATIKTSGSIHVRDDFRACAGRGFGHLGKLEQAADTQRQSTEGLTWLLLLSELGRVDEMVS